MKKLIKYKYLLGFIFCTTVAIGAGVVERFPTDTMQIGLSNSSDDKRFIFESGLGTANPTITVDSTNREFNFNRALNVVSQKLSVGNALAADQDIVFDIGAAAANPLFRWNAVDQELTFSNNGVDFSPIGSGGGGGGGVNFLQEYNFNFEDGNPPNDWTVSAGTLTSDETTPLFGEVSANWVQAAGANLDSTEVPVPVGALGRSCSTSFDYNWAGTEGDLQVTVLSGATVITTEDLAPSATTRNFSLFFDCPGTAGSLIRLRLTSINATAPLNIDEVFLGIGRNIVGGLAQNVDTKFLSANVSTAGELTELRFTNLIPGRKYRLNLFGFLGSIGLGEPNDIRVEALNGTEPVCQVILTIRQNSGTLDEGNLGASCSRSFTATSSVLEFQALGNLTGNNMIIGTGNALGTNVQLEETIQGSAINLATSGSLLSATHATDCSFARSGSTYGRFSTDATCTFSVGDNTIGFTNVIALDVGGILPGLTLQFPYLGTFEVCSTSNSILNSSRIDKRLVVDGQQIANSHYQFSSGSNATYNMCGFYTATSLGPINIEIEGAINTGTATLGKTAGAAGAALIQWSIKPVNQQMPSPVFTDITDALNLRVSGLKKTALHSCRFDALININNESGLCDWVVSTTQLGTGRARVTLDSSVFAVPPVCHISYSFPETNTTTQNRACTVQTNSTSELGIACRFNSSATTSFTNADYNLSCHGQIN